jgi:hypothetical protein
VAQGKESRRSVSDESDLKEDVADEKWERSATEASAARDLPAGELPPASTPEQAAAGPRRRNGRIAFGASRSGIPRAAIFVLGLAAVVAAFVVWLIPTSSDTTTRTEHSTTAVANSAGGKDTTTVNRTTKTRAPGAARSATVLVALLTIGVGLVLVASFWNRIQSFAIGGVSITLTDAAVATPGIALVDAAAAPVDMLSSTAADAIVSEVDSVRKRGLRLVRVDIRNGDLWAPVNLSLFVLLLARRTDAWVVVFTGQGEAGPGTYVGAASVTRLADKLAADDPELALAHRATDGIPLDRSELGAGNESIGTRFFSELTRLDAPRAQSPERVDLKKLQALAGRTLITDSVPSEGGRTLSSQEQRAIIAFPLPYVPITDHGRLDEIVDRLRLAEKIALQATSS